MTSIDTIILEAADVAAADQFYRSAFGTDVPVAVRASDAPTAGFRGFTVSLVVAQPADAEKLFGAAVDAGATVLKPLTKSFWGYGGVVQAPDGTLWKFATSSKKNTGPATGKIDEIALLLGVDDVAATKAFYTERGLAVAKSYGKKYVQFEATGPVTLGLYGRKALAKDAGVAPEGSGSHRIVVGGSAGSFTDPDGFAWEASA